MQTLQTPTVSQLKLGDTVSYTFYGEPRTGTIIQPVKSMIVHLRCHKTGGITWMFRDSVTKV